MDTYFIHLTTAFLPLLLFIPGLFFYYYSGRVKRIGYRKTGLILLALNALICTFTSAMGGASINISKKLSAANQHNLSLHAWTAMAAFILSLVIAFIAVGELRTLREVPYCDKKLFFFASLFLIFYALTIMISLKIRQGNS